MKKNAMLKIAAILMVAVLLTTCAISSTFAKYVTPAVASESNSAQVAKWGVDITANATGATLFTNDYGDVIAEGSYNVVAPGTTHTESLLNYTLAGKPEVAFKLVATVDLVLENWEANDEFYCPLVFTVNGESVDGTEYINKKTEFKADVEALIAKAMLNGTADLDAGKYYSATYPAGTELDDIADIDVTWAWAFDGNDTFDTELGDAAADGTPATVKFNFTLGAEQVNA